MNYYTHALEWHTCILYYEKRAASYYRMDKLEECLNDCKLALTLDPLSTTSSTQAAMCCLQLGLLDEVIKYCKQSDVLDQVDLVRSEMKLFHEQLNNNPEKALHHCTIALKHCKHAVSIKIEECRALIKLKRYDEVLSRIIDTKDPALHKEWCYLQVESPCKARDCLT